ncbi:MAG: discoidin domain-containing protein, partial [Bacteroidota bacterium]
CEGGGECTTPFNLALGKSTSQSAQYGDGASGFAVDGNTSGNNPWGASADLQHTATASGAWWSVDLGVLSTLKEIVIYNRSNPALYQRLSNFYVYTSASPIDGNQSNATLSSNPAINAEFFSGAAGAQETLDLGDVQGRYILIKLTGSGPLHMAEVEVNGCDDTPPPVCDIDLVSVGSTDETDCGAADGTITLTATGNAEYSIDGGSTYQASNSFTGLSAGTYTPAIRKIGLASCTEVGATVTILAPDAPVITNIATTDQSDCEVLDGSITVTATGSNLEYSIGGAFQASNFFAGLAEGSYTVTVRDAGNTSCVATAQVTISKPLGCEILCTTPINLTQEPGVGISQSSTYGDGVASLAIDGNTSGNNPWGSSADLQHTTTEAGAWLKVDLGQIGEIADITIYNRDGLQSRLNNFFIFYATDDIDADRPTVDLENDPSISNFFFPGGAGALEVIGLNQSQARYVVIKQSNIVNVTPLHIAEIQINGCPVATGGVNSGLRVAEGEVEEVLEEGINLSVYPNPYRENFTLEIEGNLEEGAHIEIHNALGQAVRSFPVPASKKVVLGKNLAMGVYWIQLFNGDSVERIKVMKAR